MIFKGKTYIQNYIAASYKQNKNWENVIKLYDNI